MKSLFEKCVRALPALIAAFLVAGLVGCATPGVSYRVGVSGGYPYRYSYPYSYPYVSPYFNWQYRRSYPYYPRYYPQRRFRSYPHGFHPRFRRRYR